jgi:glutamine phosphoribosylpyrophosphate amidotransferase
MCGVLGFHSLAPKPNHIRMFQELFNESTIRGLHAAGFSAWRPGGNEGITTFKSFSWVETFRKLGELREDLPRILIAHTRYSTSGDWHVHENNQPIHLRGASMVFNGVISQATRAEYEREYKKQFFTENDGEIFLRKVTDGEDWHGFVRDARFSFAGLHIFGGTLYAVRNRQRPLWRADFEGGTFFASTADIFARAGFDNPQELYPGTPVRLEGK